MEKVVKRNLINAIWCQNGHCDKCDLVQKAKVYLPE